MIVDLLKGDTMETPALGTLVNDRQFQHCAPGWALEAARAALARDPVDAANWLETLAAAARLQADNVIDEIGAMIGHVAPCSYCGEAPAHCDCDVHPDVTYGDAQAAHDRRLSE